MKHCKQCTYSWLPRVKSPVECPACKRRDWNKKPKEHLINETNTIRSVRRYKDFYVLGQEKPMEEDKEK